MSHSVFIDGPKITAPKLTVQTFLSGSGTYTTPANVKYIRVKMVGGGGGGGGSNGAGAGTNGTSGGNTTFGSSLLTATGGSFGKINNDQGGVGGTCTINSPATGFSFVGGQGGGGSTVSIAGEGGSTPFGGSGNRPPGATGAGYAGSTNTGSGGAGGATGSGNNSGSGGGAGGYIEAFIASPSTTYAYAVGAAGAGGSGGSGGGAAGGNGGSGIIVVEEYYI